MFPLTQALNDLNLTVVLVFSFGCLIGLLSFARLLSKFFRSYRDLTIAVLTGFLVGSIDKVWPWKIVVLTRVDSSGETVPFIEKSVMPYYFEGNPKILLAFLFAIGGRFLLTLPFTLASLALLKLKGLSIFQLISLYRLIQTLRRSGRFSFNQSNLNNSSSISVTEAYKILNLDVNKKITKEDVNKAYVKIQKKIHPDISPETARLSSIVNEAKDIVLNDIS